MPEYQVADCQQVPPGKTKVVFAGDKNLLLCNVDGRFYCIDNVCTHDDGPLGEGTLEGEVIECPRHGAQFNVKTGEVVMMPAVLALGSYPVRVEGDKIFVRVD